MDNSSITPVDNSSAVTGLQSQVQEFGQKFKALQGAIQGGNTDDAQKALNSFQSASQKASASGINPLDQNSQTNQAMQAVATAVRTGDLKSAQAAMGSMMQELQITQAVQQGGPRVKKDDNEASSPTTQISGVSLNAVA